MPCYEPPPEWSGAAAEDGRQAAKLLCAIVREQMKDRIVPIPLLRWYIDHRRVDLRMMEDPRMRSPEDDPEAVRREIGLLEVVLEKMIDKACEGMPLGPLGT